MRIMLIDDSKTMRNIQKSILRQLGDHVIEEACDGQDALSKVKVFNPDLLLVDGSMPNMDGLSFVRIFRQTDRTTPIIMVSTESDKAKVIEAIKAGVNSYVVKPFTPDLLTERIVETCVKAGLAA